MKHFFKSYAILIGIFAVMLGCLLYPSQADAKTKTYQTQDNYYGGGSCSVVISKNKVYYSITETGKIFCYDIKTKKTKTIAKTNGKGFYRLKKKGNYLYAIYDNHHGSDGSDRYIVRVSIKSGKKTTLAKGDNYVLAGKKIYYNKTKFIKSGSYGYEQSAGIYSMTLSGKKKKREKSVTFNNHRYSKRLLRIQKVLLQPEDTVKMVIIFQNHYGLLHQREKQQKSTTCIRIKMHPIMETLSILRCKVITLCIKNMTYIAMPSWFL